MNRKKLLTGLAVMTVVTLAIDQGIQHLALAGGYFQGRRVAPYDPPLFYEDQETWFKRLVSHLDKGQPGEHFFKLDAELGWCPPRGTDDSIKGYDWSGCRVGFTPLPRSKTEGVTRVLAVGCSFTRGDEVEDTETWAAVLDQERDDLELANMGVGAYGIGQALLRMRRDGLALDPDEIWLGIFPWAAPRTTNVFRPALRHWTRAPAFKPRFVLDKRNQLQLIPNPAPTLAIAHRLLSDQEFFFETMREHDARIRKFQSCWMPDGSHISHYSGIARLGLTFLETTDTLPPDLLGNPDTECYQLMIAICLQARAEAEEFGARFRILILPGLDDLQSHASETGAYWRGFVNELESVGVEVLELSDKLIQAGAIEDGEFWAEGMHYSPTGNRVVAEGLSELVKL